MSSPVISSRVIYIARLHPTPCLQVGLIFCWWHAVAVKISFQDFYLLNLFAGYKTMTVFTFGWFSILIQRKYISSTSGILWTIFQFSESVCWCCFGCFGCLWWLGWYFQSSSCWWKLAKCFVRPGGWLAGRNESCLAQRRMSGKWIGYLWATFFAILNLQLGLMYQPGPGEPARSSRIKILSSTLCILFISTRAHQQARSSIVKEINLFS